MIICVCILFSSVFFSEQSSTSALLPIQSNIKKGVNHTPDLFSNSLTRVSYYPHVIAEEIHYNTPNTSQAIRNSNDNASNTNFLTYENTTNGVEIRYPSSWLKEESHNHSSSLIVRFDPLRKSNSTRIFAHLDISAMPFPIEKSQANVLNLISLPKESLLHFKLIKIKLILPKNSSPEQNVVFTYKDPRFGIVMESDTEIVKAGKLYMIQYLAKPSMYGSLLPIIEHMLKSLTFIPTGPRPVPCDVTRNSSNSPPISGKTYRIDYQTICGKVINITLDNNNRTLLAIMSSTSNGTLEIQLPRNAIDAKKQGNMDDNFAVFEDGQYTSAVNEIKNSTQTRTLLIDFDNGTKRIEIIGTRVGPQPGPIATILTLNSIRNVPWSHAVTITGKLSNRTGLAEGIEGKNITLTFKGTGAPKAERVTTNTYGIFIDNNTAPNRAYIGWTVRALFAGDNNYQPSESAKESFSTIRHATALRVSTAIPNVAWGTTTQFFATLTDSSDDATPLPHKKIIFTGTGVIPSNHSNTTDGRGNATVKGTADNSVSPAWFYQAYFAGDAGYNSTESVIQYYPTVSHNTRLSLRVDPINVTEGKTTTLSVSLKDAETGKALVGKRISFSTAPHMTIMPQLTDVSGNFTESWIVPVSSRSFYSIQAHYGGDANYTEANSMLQHVNVISSSWWEWIFGPGTTLVWFSIIGVVVLLGYFTYRFIHDWIRKI